MINKICGRIYLITNLVNNKQYVGKTTRTIEKRFQSHLDYSKTNNVQSAIANDIKKYGKENFIIEEIDIAYNKKELKLIEGVYISWFKTLAPKGYNITNVINGKAKLSEETKQKMREKSNTPNRIEQIKKLGEKYRGISRKNSKSKYCGINLHHGRWIARIIINKKRIHLGSFLTEEDAAKARDIAELNYLKDKAVLNFPELKDKYLNNEICIRTCKKSNTKIIGVSGSGNHWRVRLKGFEYKLFKEQIDAENYANLCHKIKTENNGKIK